MTTKRTHLLEKHLFCVHITIKDFGTWHQYAFQQNSELNIAKKGYL